MRFFYSSLTDRCFSRHISTASILNSLPKRERENSERDVSLLIQRSHQRQRPLRRRMKERIFLKPSPGKKPQQKQHVGVQSREETRCIIFTSCCRCGPEQLFNLMSVCKYCKQSRTKKNPQQLQIPFCSWKKMT